jgi:acyl-CoA thioesterase
MTTPLPPAMAALLQGRAIDQNRVRFQVDESWQQGRTLFGGLLSALAVQAMRDVCGSQWALRALQTSFVGPVAPGAFDVEVQLLRQGKNIRQVQANITQADAQGQVATAGVLLGVFGGGRESSLPRLMPQRPEVAKNVAASVQLPFLQGLTPNFTQHMDFRLAEGAFPFMGTDHDSSRMHVRLKQSHELDAELLAVMLADAGPTPVLAQLKAPAPASSVSWALELRPVAEGADIGGFWRMDKDALAVDEGYVNERTALWTPDGQLAALGYQVVAVYA